mmetsp:Transcript_17714/g.44638  ORF Transcript_17714/g.44638 Transcript_17714/m.44638 type:complete len:641 (-) Transcript_17714:520-2442(-)
MGIGPVLLQSLHQHEVARQCMATSAAPQQLPHQGSCSAAPFLQQQPDHVSGAGAVKQEQQLGACEAPRPAKHVAQPCSNPAVHAALQQAPATPQPPEQQQPLNSIALVQPELVQRVLLQLGQHRGIAARGVEPHGSITAAPPVAARATNRPASIMPGVSASPSAASGLEPLWCTCCHRAPAVVGPGCKGPGGRRSYCADCKDSKVVSGERFVECSGCGRCLREAALPKHIPQCEGAQKCVAAGSTVSKAVLDPATGAPCTQGKRCTRCQSLVAVVAFKPGHSTCKACSSRRKSPPTLTAAAAAAGGHKQALAAAGAGPKSVGIASGNTTSSGGSPVLSAGPQSQPLAAADNASSIDAVMTAAVAAVVPAVATPTALVSGLEALAAAAAAAEQLEARAAAMRAAQKARPMAVSMPAGQAKAQYQIPNVQQPPMKTVQPVRPVQTVQPMVTSVQGPTPAAVAALKPTITTATAGMMRPAQPSVPALCFATPVTAAAAVTGRGSPVTAVAAVTGDVEMEVVDESAPCSVTAAAASGKEAAAAGAAPTLQSALSLAAALKPTSIQRTLSTSNSNNSRGSCCADAFAAVHVPQQARGGSWVQVEAATGLGRVAAAGLGAQQAAECSNDWRSFVLHLASAKASAVY